jgi:N-acetylmuramoyl-L-alanine amidase
MWTLAVLVTVTTAAMGARRDMVLESAPAGGPRALQVLDEYGVVLGEVRQVAQLFGFACDWDMVARRLRCERGGVSLVFSQDLAAYTANGTAAVLPTRPVRRAAELYLPLQLLAGVFNRFSERKLSLEGGGGRARLRESGFTVRSLECSEESGEARLSVLLADSCALSLSYSFPRITLEFSGATVDTATERLFAGCGLVDSVQVDQLGNDAHVSVFVSRPLRAPVAAWSEGGRRVSVLLRPHRRAASIPDSLLFGGAFADTIATVVIDPGHGGRDPGAIGPGGVQEKDLTLAVALRVRDLLQERAKVTVYMTREKDVFVPLGQRTRFANEKQADVFISIHADAIGGDARRKRQVRGYKIYFLSQAKNEEDKLVAMRENAVVELEDTPSHGGQLHGVITELVGNEYLKESQDLSIMLAEVFEEALRDVPRLHTGVGQANFYVLNGAFMPAVLIEMGFISHVAEERILKSEGFQGQLAEGILEAVTDFKEKYGNGL